MANLPTATPTEFLRPNTKENAFALDKLIDLVNQVSADAKAKLNSISELKSSVSIGDMFAMQMAMNHLSQMGELSSAVVSALNTAIGQFNRGVKGQ